MPETQTLVCLACEQMTYNTLMTKKRWLRTRESVYLKFLNLFIYLSHLFNLIFQLSDKVLQVQIYFI